MPIGLFAQSTIKLADTTQKIVRECYVLTDSSNQLTLEDVAFGDFENKFKINDGVFIDSLQSYWLWFTLENPLNKAEEWVLNFDGWNYVDCYREEQGHFEHYKTGHLVPYQQRHFPLANRNFVQLILKPHEKMRFFVRLHTDMSGYAMPTDISFKITKPLHELKKDAANQAITFFFVGIFFIMFFYNLFIFFSVRDRSYIYYMGLVLVNIQISLMTNGYDMPLYFENYAIYVPYAALIVNIFMGFFSVKFTLSVLKTNRFFYKVLTAIPIILLLLFLLSFIIPPFIAYNFSSLVGLLMSLSIFIVSIIAFRQKQVSALILLIANIFFVSGIVVVMLLVFEVLEVTVFTQNGVGIGSVGQMLMFSLVLADRINILKKQNEKQQKDLVKQLEQNIFIQQKAKEELEEKVQERTQELHLSNDELKQTVEELHSTVAQVQHQSQEIEEQNKQITASIRYAKRIQEAMLPTQEKLSEHFDEYFILYRPRDIVSGDFYYFAEVNDYIILGAIDCTGHGVPGAFMSAMGNGLLNEIVVQKKITEPNLIIRELYVGISVALKQDQNDNRDGMDLALCSINIQTSELHYSGVHNPFVYIQNSELHLIKADRYMDEKNFKPFVKHTICFKDSPICFYLFSDGYQDQIGGKEKRKFLSQNLRKLLFEVYEKDMQIQKNILNETIEAWMVRGKKKQLDDILVIGVKLQNHFSKYLR